MAIDARDLETYLAFVDAAPLEPPSIQLAPLWQVTAQQALHRLLGHGDLFSMASELLLPELARLGSEKRHPSRDRALRDVILEGCVLAVRVGDCLSTLDVIGVPWSDADRGALLVGFAQAFGPPGVQKAASELQQVFRVPYVAVRGVTAALTTGLGPMPVVEASVAPRVAQVAQVLLQADAGSAGAEASALLASMGMPVRLLAYSLRERRPILGRLVQQALLDAIVETAPSQRQALLLRADGALLVERTDAEPWPSRDDLTRTIVARVQEEAAQALQLRPRGVNVSGREARIAGFLEVLLPGPQALLRVVLRAIPGTIRPERGANRIAKLTTLMGGVSHPVWDEIRQRNLETPVIGTLGEMCGLGSSLVRRYAPAVPVLDTILDALGLAEYRPLIDQVPTAGPLTGGIAYWAFLIGALAVHTAPGRDDHAWSQVYDMLAERLAALVPIAFEEGIDTPGTLLYGLRLYLDDVLVLPERGPRDIRAAGREALRTYYQSKMDRSPAPICAMCGSHYDCTPQREADTLTKPTGYSPRTPVYRTSLERPICVVCRTEHMLRQLLALAPRDMATGAKADARQVTYVVVHAPAGLPLELALALKDLQVNLRAITAREVNRWYTSMMDLGGLEASQARLSSSLVERMPALLSHVEASRDRLQRDRGAATIGAEWRLGIPAPREASDGARFVQPLLLGLCIALVTDLPVTITTSAERSSMLPPPGVRLQVISPHAWVSTLLRGDTLGHADLLPALHRLLSAFVVHFDAHVPPGEPSEALNRFGPMVRELSVGPGALWALFQQALRRTPGAEGPRVRRYYAAALTLYGENAMSVARDLVDLQSRFYTTYRERLTNLLQPLMLAEEAIAEAERTPPLRRVPPELIGTEADPLYQAIMGRLTFRYKDYSRKYKLPLRADFDAHIAAIGAFALALTKIYRTHYNTPGSFGKHFQMLRDTCFGLALLDARARRRAAPPEDAPLIVEADTPSDEDGDEELFEGEEN